MAKKKSASRYLLCIDDHAYPASLEARKVYASVSDAAAEARGFVRVIDESGEEYLHPSRWFVEIEMPQLAAAAFVTTPLMPKWYIAHVVMAFCLTEGAQRRFPIWENMYLIKARSSEDAWTKSERVGREHEGNSCSAPRK
jgi:Domain of unknown function (DUF4288)